MNWLFFAIIPYIFWGLTNFIDKFLIENRIKNHIGIVLLGIFEHLIIGLLIFFLAGAKFPPLYQISLLLTAGIFLTFYLIPYFKALSLEDTSRVVPLFQFYPVITLLLSFIFLHEKLNLLEILGFILVITGGFILGTKKISGKIFSLRKSLYLMILSSLLYSLSNIIFKFITINNFFISFSFLMFGSALGCLLLLSKSSYRKIFWVQIKLLNFGTIIILTINAIINLLAEIFSFFAISIAPVALVSAVNGIHPFILLVYGLILTKFFPKIIKEDITRKTITIKIASSIILFLGIYFISL